MSLYGQKINFMQAMSGRARLFILSGPSGSGKTTLYKRLLRRKLLRHQLVKSISYTTRPRRRNERNGRDYLFISRAEFLRKKRQGEFLESQNVFGFLYGTSKNTVEGLLNQNENVLLCIDVKGERAIKTIFPDAVSVFVLPPSIKILNQRLKNRSTEGDREMRHRLRVAKKEISASRRYDYRIVNDNLSPALKKLEEIIIGKLKE